MFQRRTDSAAAQARDHRCSFCRRKRSDERLAAGPGQHVFICDECARHASEVFEARGVPVGSNRSG